MATGWLESNRVSGTREVSQLVTVSGLQTSLPPDKGTFTLQEISLS